MKIPFSTIRTILESEYQIYTLNDFIENKKECLEESFSVAGLIEDYEYLSIMKGETDKYDNFLIIFRDQKYSSSLPIIIENKEYFTLSELAKLYCDSPIDIGLFYQIIEEEAIYQTMDPTSLYFQFDHYVETIQKIRYLSTHKIQRNDPCPCGSGKKYKHCHGKV